MACSTIRPIQRPSIKAEKSSVLERQGAPQAKSAAKNESAWRASSRKVSN
jgi:hypothetical protein